MFHSLTLMDSANLWAERLRQADWDVEERLDQLLLGTPYTSAK